MTGDEKKELAIATVGDLVLNFLYYDRKEDEELSEDDLKELIESGALTIEEIIHHFRKGFEEFYPTTETT